MTEVRTIQLAPGVETTLDGPFENHEGERDALVAAGLASADQFPVWPKRHIFFEGPGRADWFSIQRLKGGRFVLSRFVPETRKTRTPLPPMAPLEYREHLLRYAQVSMQTLSENIRGELFENTPYRLNGAEALCGRLQAVLDDIRAAGVDRVGSRLRLVE